MSFLPSPLSALREALARGTIDPVALGDECAAAANANDLRNTYLHFDPDALRSQAQALPLRFPDPATRPPLYGVPISLKDCFDLAGTRTTCGSAFYAGRNPPATANSAVAQRLLDAGCLITGKTHMHALAYGITGQNRDFGDCLQPNDATVLTGGSSSGAAASVQEGSALAAIGTDTGGSIRVPAASCGLAGYRASHALASPDGGWPELWTGAAHLAPSFDTLGLLLRDARDMPLLAHALFGIPLAAVPEAPSIGCVPESFLHDSEPGVLATYRAWKLALQDAGAVLVEFDATAWEESAAIFAPLQASEAAAIHRGHFHHFEPAIAQRLAWGASLSAEELTGFGQRLVNFRAEIEALLCRFTFLLLPCAPVSRLPVGADQSAVRQAILRYTTPFSLAGLPAVALPGKLVGAAFGTGVQLGARPGADAALLAFAAALGAAAPRPGRQHLASGPQPYSTVTDFARLRGWSTSQPRRTAM